MSKQTSDVTATAARSPDLPVNLQSADAVQSRLILWLITVVAILMSLFQLYTAGIKPMGLFYQRSAHLGFILFLAFLIFPITGATRPRGIIGWIVDAVFLTAAFLSGFYIFFFLDDIISRAGWWSQTDIAMGIIATIAVLEASRRVVGLGMTIIGLTAISYALAGPRGALPWLGEWMPGILSHRGASLERVVGQLYLGQEGIFGLPLGVAATYVFMFVLFGAFLEVTGAGKFFIDMAFAATGRKPGGPAKAAVIASAGMGSISGSAIANVVTTGAFTIPLMKKLGYKPKEAGGIEAAASTGGQITPPLMGAGAFLISEYTNVPYIDIVMVSIFPAILYLGTVYLFVHLVAMKAGMTGMAASELPVVRDVLAAGWQFIVPLVVLVYLLVNNISPTRVGFWAIVSVIVVTALRAGFTLIVMDPKSGKPLTIDRLQAAILNGLRLMARALELGARNAVAVSVACAVAGIIVGVVGLTGLGLKFSSMMISLSGGNMALALIFVLLASLILGMGLPVTAAYIVLIVLVGPALNQEFGIPLLIAHLVVFWYSQDSNVTPPIALAGFAGAAIAGSKPMETSMQAWKYAKGLYLIPAFMVYNPEIIMGGETWYVIWTGILVVIGLVGFASAIEGYLFTWMDKLSRLLIVPGVIAIFNPDEWIEAAGGMLVLGILIWNWLKSRRAGRGAANPVASG
ncbi:MAG: TRAP transporter fused permease subunit [Pseudotabrizicola sp.]|uniref:TRAP transporter permease n=1 Tax=Pseudotabrizicola sp. TaxID=2939647 RepID=UPI00272F679F|nr:TRAP transporter fused permease subunit [Pseudotabrizicola sp.]MDP2083518.1 TRAP transporter fused permease subunit [Pseudotabrizicola sp.]MDZ7575037.1 TRAP transporter fused permease subunit [Pseudotabrizicola sp.]